MPILIHGASQRLWKRHTMGLGSYFKAPKPKTQPQPPPSEKPPPPIPSNAGPVPSPRGAGHLTPAGTSNRPTSISARSARSTASSAFFDDIRHEVMVNYLYQQQCLRLWVGDLAGEAEGVLLRKARGQYMACPPQLAASPLAASCAALNVQVRHIIPTSHTATTFRTYCSWMRQDREHADTPSAP